MSLAPNAERQAPGLRAAPDVLATARVQRWDPAETLRVLLEEEARGRDAATIAARRRRAGFPTGKTFETWREPASSNPVATQALRTLECLRRAENLGMVGPSVTGKGHLPEAPGHAAIDDGMSRGAPSRPSDSSCAAIAPTTP